MVTRKDGKMSLIAKQSHLNVHPRGLDRRFEVAGSDSFKVMNSLIDKARKSYKLGKKTWVLTKLEVFGDHLKPISLNEFSNKGGSFIADFSPIRSSKLRKFSIVGSVIKKSGSKAWTGVCVGIGQTNKESH